MKFDSPEILIEEIKNGRMILLVDDEDRENEGDLVLAADHITPAMVNFMAREARGLICLAMAPEQIEKLALPMMVREDLNASPNHTAFTVSVEASFGVTTGISAADRAHTILVASRPEAQPSDLRSPGHIFPLKAQKGGVLKRAGHTEGSVDLAALAGLNPAAVICEVMNDDGSMARVPELLEFSQKHKIRIGSIVDLIEYRLKFDRFVSEVMNQTWPTPHGDFLARVFKNQLDGMEHLVLQKGSVDREKPTLVRVQVMDALWDGLQQMRMPDQKLNQYLQILGRQGGVLVCLQNPVEGLSLSQRLRLLKSGASAKDMDARNYGLGAQILRALGVEKIRYLGGQSAKPQVGLKGFNLEIVEWVSFGEENENWTGESSI